jgi:replicative DNA helicase
MQVDVTTRMGALTPATPTGLPTLDRLLIGGLRSGTMLALAGEPGSGRTAFALLLSYMAARARAGVVFTSVSLDETEVMARLAARALHREYPDARTPYGSIWSGQAWQDDVTRRPVGDSVETMVRKVGAYLHLFRAKPLDTVADLGECAAHLWTRLDRVVLVVDDIEAFSAGPCSDPARARAQSSSLEDRIVQTALELRHLSEQGCAVVVTVLARHADLLAPASTLTAEIRQSSVVHSAASERMIALGMRPVDLVITKNRLGPTGTVPLRFIPGAAVFEERGS